MPFPGLRNRGRPGTLSRAVGRFGRWKHPVAVRVRELVTWGLLGNPIGAKNIERDLAYDF